MTDTAVETSFRQESARLVAMLVRAFGPSRLGLAEDVVQETFLRALRVWPISGEPANPSAWLTTVAKRLAVDALRREGIYEQGPWDSLDETPAPPPDPTTLDDAEIDLLFLCCHPALPPANQIALTLRELCGLSTREIARGLLLTEEALAQRLVRAKRTLQTIDPHTPAGEMETRLESVLRVLYLLFNEGYSAHTDPSLVRSEICDDAIQLTYRLANTRIGNTPATYALLALMLLHSSRLGARIAPDGSLCLLEDQDRSHWDHSRIQQGVLALAESAKGDTMTAYHYEAEIAVIHALSRSYAETEWPSVLRAYDGLAALSPTPVILLNRAIALSMVEGPKAGLVQIEQLERDGNLSRYHLLPATKARMLELLECLPEARTAYETALKLAENPAEQEFLRRRIECLH